jgi:cytoskeleton protein RodZ
MNEPASSPGDSQDTPHPATWTDRPGATLRAAREGAGLSLEEVAVQTKIALPLLQAIERDDFARLGQPVYARGYLRRYAKAMNVPESQVLVALDTREAPKSPPPATSQIAQEQVQGPSGGGRPMFWLLLVIVFAALIGGVVLQLRGKDQTPVAAPAPSATQMPTTPASTMPGSSALPAEEASPVQSTLVEEPAGELGDEAQRQVQPAAADDVVPAPATATPTQDETPAANPPPVQQPEPGAVAPTPTPE